ncbi:MAG: pYEATS domain-containing protein [Chitinophagaceae bacterium]
MSIGKTPSPFLVVFTILAIAGLVFGGIKLIQSSGKVYEQSYLQSEKLMEKMLDSSFNKQPFIVSPSYGTIKDGYAQATTLFLIALGIFLFFFLFPRLQNLSIGPTGISVTLKDVQQNVELLMKQANAVQGEIAGKGGSTTKNPVRAVESKPVTSELVDNDDPQKGKWGGRDVDNFREISAKVKNTPWHGFYEVTITVASTSAKFPLEGLVRFHLHNTFKNADPVITARDNKAVLKLSKVYGAFTVGAEADEGRTKLELDLSTIEGAPEDFLTS